MGGAGRGVGAQMPLPVLSVQLGRTKHLRGASCIPRPTLGLSGEVGRDPNTDWAPTASLDPCQHFLRMEKRTNIPWPLALALATCHTMSWKPGERKQYQALLVPCFLENG